MILSGYTRQVKLIQGLALECRLYDVSVKTVDGSQGDEAQIVILSTVRDGRDLGFIQSASRANVATSRQKAALYIIGNWGAATSKRGAKEYTNYFGKYLEAARFKWPNYVLHALTRK